MISPAQDRRFALDTQTQKILTCRVEQVDDFHSRYQKHSKTYEFIVDYGRPKNPMMRHLSYPLNVEKMQRHQVGEEPMIFTGFTASGTPAWKIRFVRLQKARLVEDARTSSPCLYLFGQRLSPRQSLTNMVNFVED